MAKPKMHTDYLSAVKKAKKEHPFSLLPAQIPENSGNYAYPLRRTTVATTVKLHQPILEAIRMYARTENTVLNTPYMMIATMALGAKGTVPRYYLETIDDDGDTLFVEAQENHVRISKISASDILDRSPLVAFSQQTVRHLTMVSLALLPHVLEIDKRNGGGKLNAAVDELGLELEDAATWSDVNDIPELVKEHLYFTDAVIPVLDSIELDFGPANSAEPKEVDADVFVSKLKVKGSLVCQNLVNDWAPRFIETNGSKVQRMAKALTIGTAKQMFCGFSAGRVWTPAEKALIPSLPDDMPVMPEVGWIAKRIVRDGTNGIPARNGMWRSDTGYGKSTGIKQLACILNVPLLIMTCHPNMETQDFMSTFVPATDDVDTEGYAPMVTETEVERPPFFEEAMAYVATLEDKQRETLFDAKTFYNDLMIEDTEELAATLIGSKQDLSAEDLFSLYMDVRSATLRETPLHRQIKKLEASAQSANAADKDKGNEPQFVHVESNYIKAMERGYLCEVQEPSRIRDAGVLVGLNEFYAPGSTLQLVSGKTVKRHEKAVCIFTDNVGYAGCKTLDQSVIRRQDFITDSDELTKEQLFERIKYNTHCTDIKLMELAYSYWNKVKEFCAQNSITDGSTSPTELECYVKELMYEGLDALEVALNDCVISKATSNREDQRDIRTVCQTLSVA